MTLAYCLSPDQTEGFNIVQERVAPKCFIRHREQKFGDTLSHMDVKDTLHFASHDGRTVNCRDNFQSFHLVFRLGRRLVELPVRRSTVCKCNPFKHSFSVLINLCL